jgi:hypothetical protein
MKQGAAVWLVLLIAFVAANLPFLSQRILLVGPRPAHKAFGWRLLELVILGAATIAIGFAFEVHIGQRQPQGWEFYAAFACLFLTLAFPGFVWRMLRRHRHG